MKSERKIIGTFAGFGIYDTDPPPPPGSLSWKPWGQPSLNEIVDRNFSELFQRELRRLETSLYRDAFGLHPETGETYAARAERLATYDPYLVRFSGEWL